MTSNASECIAEGVLDMIPTVIGCSGYKYEDLSPQMTAKH